MSITVIGSVFVDHKAYPYNKFIPDGRNPGYDIQIYGGVGRNIAEDVSRIGQNVSFVGLVDESGTGSDIISSLKKSRIDTSFVKACPSGMGKWIAIFDETGDVAASISVRPDLNPLTELIEKEHRRIFENSEGIILEIDIEGETVEKIFHYAEMYNVKVCCVVSIMSISLQRKKFFPLTECFICNLQEAEMLFETEFPKDDVSYVEKYISENLGLTGLNKLIVTMGEQGAVYCDSSGCSGHCPAEEAELVDSTGAGDAFASGAFAALIKGRSMVEACRIGAKTASLVISHDENVVQDFNEDVFGLT